MPLTNFTLREIGARIHFFTGVKCRGTVRHLEVRNSLRSVCVLRRGAPLATTPQTPHHVVSSSVPDNFVGFIRVSVLSTIAPQQHSVTSWSVFQLGGLPNMTFNTETQVRSQASVCKFYGGPSGTGKGLPPGTPVRSAFPCQCHCTKAPCLFAYHRQTL